MEPTPNFVRLASQTILDLTNEVVHTTTSSPATNALLILPMETLVRLPEDSAPSTVQEVLAALRKEHLEPRHESKAWGDWIYLESYSTVISIESNRGLSSSATIEHGEGEEDGEPVVSILRAFGKIGWHGVDDDGEFPLD
jgi:hypothetical protein